MNDCVPVALVIVLTTVACSSSSTSPTSTSSAMPSVMSLSPTNGSVGTVVTIAGTNFGATEGSSTVTFNGTTATPTTWAATSINVPVPAGATTGNLVLTVGAVVSTGVAFTVLPSKTYTLTGTVLAAVDGHGQGDFKTFNVGQSGGAVTVTLTSAVETFPNGTLNPAVVMGLGVGTPSGPSTCTLPTGSTPALLQGSAMSILSGTLNAGTYCVHVSDQTIQKGRVAYTVVVSSP
jgi:hypothetical protein